MPVGFLLVTGSVDRGHGKDRKYESLVLGEV